VLKRFVERRKLRLSNLMQYKKEDLIAIVIDRLQCFQEGAYKCRENAIAITKLEEALLWLRKRTMDREKRNVEGTSII